MLDQELIQESVESVDVLPETSGETGKKFVKGALIVTAVVGTVLLVKKVIVPKVKAWNAKRVAAKQQAEAEAE